MTMNVIDVVGASLLVLALSAYWSASHESFERLWLSLVPAPQRPRARNIWRGIEASVGAHLRAELAESTVATLLVAIAFRLAHLPTPILPALAVGVLRMVPFGGPLLAAAAAALAGWAVDGPTAALAGAGTLAMLIAVDHGVARRSSTSAAQPDADRGGVDPVRGRLRTRAAAGVHGRRRHASRPRARHPHSPAARPDQPNAGADRAAHRPPAPAPGLVSQDEAIQLGNVVARWRRWPAPRRRRAAGLLGAVEAGPRRSRGSRRCWRPRRSSRRRVVDLTLVPLTVMVTSAPSSVGPWSADDVAASTFRTPRGTPARRSFALSGSGGRHGPAGSFANAASVGAKTVNGWPSTSWSGRQPTAATSVKLPAATAVSTMSSTPRRPRRRCADPLPPGRSCRCRLHRHRIEPRRTQQGRR